MNSEIRLDNRIDNLFVEKEGILSVYFTAGYPELDCTSSIIQALDSAGVDMIEVGIPFSDPVADGEVIQKSSQRALQNGINLNLLFEQLDDIRSKTDIPLIMMGYLNPIYRFGFERFCEASERIGIDGVIIPDLPLIEVEQGYGDVLSKHNLKNIMLISPNTTEERVRVIDRLSSGFIYMVSSASTTGAKSGLHQDQLDYFNKIKSMELDNPTVIGFGISDKNTFNTAVDHAHGAIIGSAFIKHLTSNGYSEETIADFVKSIRS